MHALSDDWTEVYCGVPALALLLRDRLAESGVPAFVPDANLRFLDPFSTGGRAFELRVLVARTHEAAARELLLEDREAAAELEVAPEDEIDPRRREVHRIGERIVDATGIEYFSPAALWLAPRYFALARGLGSPPRRRRAVIVAVLIAAFETSILVAVVAIYLLML